MTLDEIITKLEAFVEETKEEVDAQAKEWARSMAKMEHNADLKKAKLASAMQKYSGSDRTRESLALTDLDYRSFVDKVKLSEDEAYFLNKYLRDHGMERIGVLRSLLAFHRGRISQDV